MYEMDMCARSLHTGNTLSVLESEKREREKKRERKKRKRERKAMLKNEAKKILTNKHIVEK